MKSNISQLNLLHDPLVNDRVQIESLGDWQVLGSDRRHPAYEGFFKRGDTPVQLLLSPETIESSALTGNTGVSIITPCLATEGRFEILIGNEAPVRKCCYKCVRQLLQKRLGIQPPDHMDWIVYMLLECNSYMNGAAPAELPK
jgi:hypothetical protein